jgi:pimeloyl-ACP methyl ester carboxylesterase
VCGVPHGQATLTKIAETKNFSSSHVDPLSMYAAGTGLSTARAFARLEFGAGTTVSSDVWIGLLLAEGAGPFLQPRCGDWDSKGAAAMEVERSLKTVEEGTRTGYLEDESVCGAWTERLLSALYHLFAGRPNASRLAGIRGLEPVAFVTQDHRKLGGYKLKAHADASRPPRGYVLVALGNAMLADQVVGDFRFLQAEGFDVYVYDYRGYGISEGRSRFFAIRSDYIELIEHLDDAGYAKRFLYGMSLGGVFLLNAIAAGALCDAAMIDSPPSRISGYGCPRRFDPVENLPQDSSRLGFIFGHRDTVVPPSAWRELSEAATVRGAGVLERADLAHPMMDRDPSTRQRRFDAIRAFFAGHAR